ncbi:four helix bundle protein [Mesonia sp.]|uniref:four helix bundle protein n=1 Tax=Mesonia sp. TaxID=1960830 RepID=UPI00176AE702|nr:four helix bundle protein [Mesonia sp.]HIB37860.1 four helix bundle protein [Mesonia sp.]HIO27212.1 four helix bundle protein [Flavobacteriaceae bacterium]
MTSEELENRLIDFAVSCIKATKRLDQSFASQHLSSQLIRSATSVALNYSEAIAAQSARDYIHKMQICLKELRESKTNLRIQKGADLLKQIQNLDELIDESNQLILIFSKSIYTSKKKNQLKN